MVEIAQVVLHKADQLGLVADLRDADVLSREDATEIDLLSVRSPRFEIGQSCSFPARSGINRVDAGRFEP